MSAKLPVISGKNESSNGSIDNFFGCEQMELPIMCIPTPSAGLFHKFRMKCQKNISGKELHTLQDEDTLTNQHILETKDQFPEEANDVGNPNYKLQENLPYRIKDCGRAASGKELQILQDEVTLANQHSLETKDQLPEEADKVGNPNYQLQENLPYRVKDYGGATSGKELQILQDEATLANQHSLETKDQFPEEADEVGNPNYQLQENLPFRVKDEPEEQDTAYEVYFEETVKTKFEFWCDWCGEGFQYESYLIDHMKKHRSATAVKDTNPSSFSANTKEDSFNESTPPKAVELPDVTNFYEARDQRGVFQCKECDYSASFTSLIERHVMIRHTNERPFSCTECEFKCVTNSILRQHVISRHTNIRPYSCTKCEYKTSVKSNLRNHTLANHTDYRPHSCPHCEFKCLVKFGLIKHIRSKHTNERPYSCTQCEFKGVTKNTLDRHVIAKHTDEQRSSCPHCEYRCVRTNSMKKHIMAVHNKERPHSCTQCEYKCSSKYSLKRHVLAIHTKDRPLSCTECEYKCLRKKNLIYHLKAKHSK